MCVQRDVLYASRLSTPRVPHCTLQPATDVTCASVKGVRHRDLSWWMASMGLHSCATYCMMFLPNLHKMSPGTQTPQLRAKSAVDRGTGARPALV